MRFRAASTRVFRRMSSSRPSMLINGALVHGGTTAAVINPASGQEFERVPNASAADVDSAVAAAKAAFGGWAALPFAKRAACFISFAALLERDKGRLAAALSQEQGKPLKPFAVGEVKMAIGKAKACADSANELVPEEYERNTKGRCTCLWAPRGVVAAICPWNFPLAIAVNKMLCPLVGGNTVVLKPSPMTPLSTLLLSDLAMEAFPPGVVNILAGGSDVGAVLVEHPDVATVTFTGSSATGKRIMASASPSLKKVLLELGGNDPAIVLPGSDVAALAPQLFQKAMFNTGQVCVALKRLYVHASQYEEMVAALGAEAREKVQQLGDGLTPGTVYGPLNNAMQRDRVEELVEDARADGARVVAGGERVRPPSAPQGFFYAPTILADLPDTARIVREEQFGPALPVLSYETVDEAVERANDSEYGLGASVWGANVAEATGVAARLQAGSIWINNHLGSGLDIDAPFGGVKESGIGKENGGKLAFKAFCDEKYLYAPFPL